MVPWASLEEVLPPQKLSSCDASRFSVCLHVNPVHGQPKSALHEIWQAATCEDAERAFDQFIVTYEAKYPVTARSRIINDVFLCTNIQSSRRLPKTTPLINARVTDFLQVQSEANRGPSPNTEVQQVRGKQEQHTQEIFLCSQTPWNPPCG